MTDQAAQTPDNQDLPGQGGAVGTDAPGAQGASDDVVNPLLDRSAVEGTQEPGADQQADPTGEPGKPEGDEPQDQAPAEEPTSLGELIESEFSGDPAASLVYKQLERLTADIDVERAFGKAILENDPRFIDEQYLREAIGDQADEARQMAEYLFGYAERMQQKLEEQLYADIPGGYEGARTAAMHFKKTASPEQQELVRAMLDSGNMQLMRHGLQQIMQHSRGTVPQHRPAVVGTTQGVQPMTRAEFGKAVLANPNMSQAEYNKLRERLAAGLN